MDFLQYFVFPVHFCAEDEPILLVVNCKKADKERQNTRHHITRLLRGRNPRMGVTRTLSPYGRSWGSRRGIHTKRSFAETRPYIVNSVKWCMYHFLHTSCQWSRRPAPSGSAAPGGRPVSLRTRCVRSPRGLCIGTKAHKTKRREERDISVFWVIQRKAMNEVGDWARPRNDGSG